jgi:hypothetical protein
VNKPDGDQTFDRLKKPDGDQTFDRLRKPDGDEIFECEEVPVYMREVQDREMRSVAGAPDVSAQEVMHACLLAHACIHGLSVGGR